MTPTDEWTPDAAGGYLDHDPDVASHMACVEWTTTPEDTLVSDPALSVAARADRAGDLAMRDVVTDAAEGPMITDPWTLTRLCTQHGYVADPGSFADAFAV